MPRTATIFPSGEITGIAGPSSATPVWNSGSPFSTSHTTMPPLLLTPVPPWAINLPSADSDVAGMLVANRAFHFGLFALSPLGAIRQDVERLWNTSEPYRATYLWLPSTRRRIIREHEQMLGALARGDRTRLVQIADRHRGAARAAVTELLAVEAF